MGPGEQGPAGATGGRETITERPGDGFKITSQALGKKTIKPAISAEMPNESVR
jgi:hypothetical protein